MPRYTPLYRLPALSPTDRARNIADIDWANAQAVEAILANQGQPPLSSDLVSLVKRLNAIEPVVGTPVAKDATWDLTGTTLTKNGNDVTLVLSASKNANVAASSQAIALTVPAGFRPTVQQLQSGVAWSYSAPYANPVQIAVNGELTVFTTSGGAQSRFSALMRWRAA